jgi:hypothetical protein
MSSQINPNNVDGNYPVAGVPNNTQGFRDNFTNIKTNFQYAESEIDDLQSKVVLKAALTGTTLDNNMNDSLLYAVKLQDVSYTYLPITTTSGSILIDYSAAPFQQISTTGSVSISFTNWPASGSAGTVRIGFNITNVAHTVTLPAAVSQGISTLGGISPGTPGVSNTITFGAVGNYAFEFVTIDGGTTVWVFDDSRAPGKIATVLDITNTTVSTSTTTGALIVAGGVGIGGNLNVGGVTALTGNITGNLNVTGNIAGGNISTVGIATSGTASVTGNVIVGGTAGISLTSTGTVGYTAGAGGTIAQSGNKTQTVILNKPSGEITMQNTSLAADTAVSFTLTNSTIATRDLLLINLVGGGTPGAYFYGSNCTTGSAVITVRNLTAGPLSESLVLRYAVIKGSIT